AAPVLHEEKPQPVLGRAQILLRVQRPQDLVLGDLRVEAGDQLAEGLLAADRAVERVRVDGLAARLRHLSHLRSPFRLGPWSVHRRGPGPLCPPATSREVGGRGFDYALFPGNRRLSGGWNPARSNAAMASARSARCTAHCLPGRTFTVRRRCTASGVTLSTPRTDGGSRMSAARSSRSAESATTSLSSAVARVRSAS